MLTKKEAREFLKQLYSLVPEFKCPKDRSGKLKCGESRCCGPIAMIEAEYGLIKRAMRRMSRKHLIDRRRELEEGDLTCPLLDKDGLCMVYEVRPLICRLWGSTKGMKCPKKKYTKKEEEKLIDDDLRIFQRYKKSAKVYDLAKLVR